MAESKTACGRGHPFPESLRPGRKDCAICHRLRERRRKSGSEELRPAPTACPAGHPYPESLRPSKKSCAVCHREAQARRYRANPAKSIAAATEWQRANRERRREYMRAWRDDNREWWRTYFRKVSRERRLGRDKDAVAYADILRLDPCCYCGGPAGSIDHITPVAAGGTNAWDTLSAA
jgi:hypothetical protein